MQCAKCKHQNPDEAKTCQSCGCNLTNLLEVQPLVRISQMAMASLILGILSTFTFMMTSIPSIFFGLISIRKIRNSKGALKGKNIAKAGIIISFVIISFHLIFIMLWRVDAPPIPNDYTIADLRSTPAEYEESYELLRSLTNKNYNYIEEFPDLNTPENGLSWDDRNIINNIYSTLEQGNTDQISNILSDNAEIIIMAWDKTRKAVSHSGRLRM